MPSDDAINILVVDDLPDKLLALQTVLEDLGQNVVCALSGREALRRLLERDFAVILLDVNMPDMDGFETAAHIRRHKRCAQTPIIFVTAFSDDLHAARGYSLGAVDYILSPVVPEVLRTKVGVFVELFKKTEAVKRHAEERIAFARAQAARTAAEDANRRLAYLAEAGAALASSLDAAVLVRGLARLAVPFLADLAIVTRAEQPGSTQTVLAWTDPVHGTCEREAAALAELPGGLAEALGRVLATGKSEVLTGASLAQAVRKHEVVNGTHRPVPTDCAGGGAVVLPLAARGRALGALALCRGPAGRPGDPADLALAEDLAGRAAIALDNARLYQNVQEADRRKNEFLAMLSHELRNPLAPIFNALHILRLCGPDESARAEAQTLIERQVRQLAGIVDGLLDVFRITHGKIALRKEPLDLARVVGETVEDHRRALEGNGLTVTLERPAEPAWVQADRTRLAQVLSNLLQNAAKFTNSGGRVAVRVVSDAAASRVAVAVRDTGIGIASEMLPHVFETFTQADRSLDRSRGGLGLGLALVKGLVELHGGRVQASSPGVGRGAEVGFWLPLGVEPPTPEEGAGARAEVAAARLRILIVEDSYDAALSLRALLMRHGHEVTTAHTGPEGVAAARSQRPDVVLCDLGLPEMDGYDVAAALRRDPQTASAHLIAVSGYGQEEDRRRSREVGFDMHMTKPVDPEALRRLLADLVVKA